MEKATSTFLSPRISPLIKLGQAIERDSSDSCTLARALQKEDEEVRRTSKTSTFSALIKWEDERGRDRENRVFVKMLYVDPQDVYIPTTFLNELYLMKTVVRDMIRYSRSPHFIFPVAQIHGQDKDLDVRTLKQVLQIDPDRGCRTDDGRLAIYNVMEYYDPDYFISLKDLLYVQNVTDRELLTYLKQIFFQVFYNLTVMEKLRFRHGDLHLQNILIGFSELSQTTPVIYSVDPQTHYKVTSQAFIYFIDFDRSSVLSFRPYYQSMAPTPEELKSFPCVGGDRMGQLPEGFQEGCWDWNPHADWTRLLSAFILELVKAKGQTVADMIIEQQLFYFPSIYAYFTAVLGDIRTYKFGRPSLKELSRTIPEQVSRKTTPGNILRAYAQQFSSESWLQILKVPEPGVPVFKAY